MSVPPDIEARWTSDFTFLYINLKPSSDNGDPVEQIVLRFFNLYFFLFKIPDLLSASMYLALTPNKVIFSSSGIFSYLKYQIY